METPYNQPLFIATSYNSDLFIKSSFYLFKNSGNTLCSFCGLCRDGGGLSCWKRIRCVLYPLHRTALHRTCLTHVTCDRPANKCALRLLLPLPLPLSLSVCVCAGVFVFVCGTATAGYKQHKHLYLSASVCVCVCARISSTMRLYMCVCVLYINRPLGGSPSPNTLASPPTSASPFLYLFILPAPLHSSSHFTLLLSLTAPLALRARSNWNNNTTKHTQKKSNFVQRCDPWPKIVMRNLLWHKHMLAFCLLCRLLLLL